MNLYYVHAVNADGESYDSCYWASSAQEAGDLWAVDWDLLGAACDAEEIDATASLAARQHALDTFLESLLLDGVQATEIDLSVPAASGPARYREGQDVKPQFSA